MSSIIEVEGLGKRFGATPALDDVSFVVEQGSVLGLLGPNGAGKTTTIRVLATLLTPDRGRARVGGVDVVDDPSRVRSMIGLTGQYAAVDEKLTGAENLTMVARLFGSSKAAARVQAGELLERFGLSAASDRLVGTYSGGMRRRIDLAVSLVGQPRVLFLDEPTTGLDPSSRLQLWAIVRELVADGTALLLTTQYLEEADELADRIVVIDRGVVIAAGTGDQLKARVGGRTLEVTLTDSSQMAAADDLVRRSGGGPPRLDAEAGVVAIPVGGDTVLASRLVAAFSDASMPIDDFGFRRPTLDHVFLALTGHTADTTVDPIIGPATDPDGPPSTGDAEART